MKSTFPKTNQCFRVTHNRYPEHSFRNVIFKCTASDANTVIGETMKREILINGPQTFDRSECVFLTVSRQVVAATKKGATKP